jgi:hypothetical protein
MTLWQGTQVPCTFLRFLYFFAKARYLSTRPVKYTTAALWCVPPSRQLRTGCFTMSVTGTVGRTSKPMMMKAIL